MARRLQSASDDTVGCTGIDRGTHGGFIRRTDIMRFEELTDEQMQSVNGGGFFTEALAFVCTGGVSGIPKGIKTVDKVVDERLFPHDVPGRDVGVLGQSLDGIDNPPNDGLIDTISTSPDGDDGSPAPE